MSGYGNANALFQLTTKRGGREEEDSATSIRSYAFYSGRYDTTAHRHHCSAEFSESTGISAATVYPCEYITCGSDSGSAASIGGMRLLFFTTLAVFK